MSLICVKCYTRISDKAFPMIEIMFHSSGPGGKWLVTYFLKWAIYIIETGIRCRYFYFHELTLVVVIWYFVYKGVSLSEKPVTINLHYYKKKCEVVIECSWGSITELVAFLNGHWWMVKGFAKTANCFSYSHFKGVGMEIRLS